MKKQVMSLIILTVGVMLCNSKNKEDLTEDDKVGNKMIGIAATLGKFICLHDFGFLFCFVSVRFFLCSRGPSYYFLHHINIRTCFI